MTSVKVVFYCFFRMDIGKIYLWPSYDLYNEEYSEKKRIRN
jgi:hypothetical protein